MFILILSLYFCSCCAQNLKCHFILLSIIINPIHSLGQDLISASIMKPFLIISKHKAVFKHMELIIHNITFSLVIQKNPTKIPICTIRTMCQNL